jgi:hypothetical protein
VGGAFISGPLAIVVIGGLFTSTALTLVLVPVLYSLASRFTGPRTSRDLDALLDAAEDRRFTPLGQRGSGEMPVTAAPAPPAAPTPREYEVALSLEPEPGHVGDPNILEVLRAKGFAVTPIEATRKMRVDVSHVAAGSSAEASNNAMAMVRHLIPATGYKLAEYQVVHREPVAASDGSR